jgi:hypothetical protein
MAIFDRFNATTEEYKAQVRRIVFGLAHHRICREKVLKGSVSMLELAFASNELFSELNSIELGGRTNNATNWKK